MPRRSSDVAERQPTASKPRSTAKPASAGRRPAAARPRSKRAAVDAAPAQRSGLAVLFRGAGSVLGQVSGIDAPTRALERLAASAEHAADFLDRLDAEVGIEHAAQVIERLGQVADIVEDMHRSLREIEDRVVELHMRVNQPLQRLNVLRRRKDDAPPAPTPGRRRR